MKIMKTEMNSVHIVSELAGSMKTPIDILGMWQSMSFCRLFIHAHYQNTGSAWNWGWNIEKQSFLS